MDRRDFMKKAIGTGIVAGSTEFSLKKNSQFCNITILYISKMS
jgi:hypothetical protein